jgi:hypothetical protein
MRKNGGNKKRVVYVRGMFMYSCVLPKVWEHPLGSCLGVPVPQETWAGNKAQQKCAPATEECNRYDLTTTDPCFGLANHNDWSRWFAISSPHLYAVPVSVFWIKIKSKKKQTWMPEMLLQGVTY